MIAPPHRLHSAIATFLAQCEHDQIAFEPQRAFSTQAEAEGHALEFWARYAELYRAIGREPPSWPSGLSNHPGEPMI